MSKKQVILLVIMVIFVIGLCVGGFFLFKDGKKNDIDDSMKKIEITPIKDMSKYNGYWYEDKDKVGLNYIKINSNVDQSMNVVLSFYCIKLFDNIVISLTDDNGYFEYVSGTDSLKGNIYFYDDKLVLSISESTYVGIDLGSTYSYIYRSNNEIEYVEDNYDKISTSYIGTWYTSMKDNFSDSIVVTAINKNELSFKLVLNGNKFNEIKATINDNKGDFNNGSIKGTITLKDKEIVLSNLVANNVSKSYNFTFKTKIVGYSDYVGKWILDEKNTLEVTEYDSNRLLVNMLFTPYADLRNVTVNMINNHGTFECVGSNSKVVAGNVILDSNKIYVVITNSNVKGLVNGDTFEYHK